MDIKEHIIRLIEINPGAFLSSLSLISISLSYNLIHNYTNFIFDVLLLHYILCIIQYIER